MQEVEVKENEISNKEHISYELKEKIIYKCIKRLLDIVFSFSALIILSPILFIVFLFIFIEDGKPIIYSQIRIGKDGKPFRLYKIRSMKVTADKEKNMLADYNESNGATFKIENDPRITKVGKIIRRFSIDELAQLINIIKGDMSIVGPRPFIEEEQVLLSDTRLKVKPGLTCYWQINGGNKLTIEQTEYFDEKYICECSIMTDIKIIFKTLFYVIKGGNI